MKDKIREYTKAETIAINYGLGHKLKTVTLAMEEYAQQALQQILEEAGEELPNKDKVTDSADKYSDNLKLENRLLESQAFEGHIAGAEWMRSEASKVVGKLKEDRRILEQNHIRQSEVIQQLKEELARKEEQVRSLKYWVEQNKFEQYADSKGREIVNAFDLTEELDLILAPKDR